MLRSRSVFELEKTVNSKFFWSFFPVNDCRFGIYPQKLSSGGVRRKVVDESRVSLSSVYWLRKPYLIPLPKIDGVIASKSLQGGRWLASTPIEHSHAISATLLSRVGGALRHDRQESGRGCHRSSSRHRTLSKRGPFLCPRACKLHEWRSDRLCL